MNTSKLLLALSLSSVLVACGGNCPTPQSAQAATQPVALDHESTPETHMAAALELLDAVHFSTTIDASLDVSLAAQLQAQPDLRPHEAVMRRFFQKYAAGNALREPMAALYVERFSELELRQLVEFNRSPVGQRAIAEMPALMQAGAQIGGQTVADHQNELIQMLQESGYGAPTKPAQP